MIALEVGQVWRSRRDEAGSRRIISVVNEPSSLMVEYVDGDQTLTTIGTSFRRWIDISGATLTEPR